LGEDGLAGFSDDHQRLCFALTLWNGKDPILKQRRFGLTNSEGNHGEDVKEYYFYLDSTPTHSYMKYLYKYPQNAYPYNDLVETNRRRGRVEYAKASPTDILIQISVGNRRARCRYAARAASAVVPQYLDVVAGSAETLRQKPGENIVTIEASHAELGGFLLQGDGIRACCLPKTTPMTSGFSARPTRRPTPCMLASRRLPTPIALTLYQRFKMRR
jgi:hypothetical protein